LLEPGVKSVKFVEMETDALFYRLFKNLPETLFYLLGLPPEQVNAYRFDSVEVKKSLRIDGLYLPNQRSLPLYFLEIQFQPVKKFYANLFAKVFSYLDENDPTQDWRAMAIFPSRSVEPKQLVAYTELLESNRVTRIYLDEYPTPPDPPYGLGILQLGWAPENEVKELVRRLVERAKVPKQDRELREKVIELAEEMLVCRFTELSREEVCAMFHLANIRDTRVWKEVYHEAKEEGKQEGKQEGREEGREDVKKELVHKWLARGVAPKEIAERMDISVREVRRLAKESPQS
jgi:predicted transposase/invertase (TIGR01784 family)